MEIPQKAAHELADLFRQLGLPDDSASIELFIKSHYPLPKAMRLSEAPFWNRSQQDLLKQSIKDDADWAVYVDMLDARLREPPTVPVAAPQ